jgi:hypothetical protein
VLSQLWERLPAQATLKDWQTAISATAGFCAVVLTLIVNAWLARATENRQRRHKRMALRTAFETELSFLKLQAESTADTLRRPSDARGTIMRVVIPTPIYDHYSAKLSALTAKEISGLLSLYLYLSVASDRVLLLGERLNISPNAADDWLRVPPDVIEITIANMKTIGEMTTQARAEIERARQRDRWLRGCP